MADLLLDQLIAATERLKRDRFWLDLMAENLNWSSCEGFFQCSLLGAFNVTSEEHIADRERVFSFVKPRAKPDLLLFERQEYAAWWRARYTTRGLGLSKLCRGLVEIKLVWTEGNAEASASLPWKTLEVASDARKLAELCQHEEMTDCRGYLGVLLSGLHANGRGQEFLEQGRSAVQGALNETGLVQEYRTIPLLQNASLERWMALERGNPAPVLWADLLLVTLGHGQGTCPPVKVVAASEWGAMKPGNLTE